MNFSFIQAASTTRYEYSNNEVGNYSFGTSLGATVRRLTSSPVNDQARRCLYDWRHFRPAYRLQNTSPNSKTQKSWRRNLAEFKYFRRTGNIAHLTGQM